MVVNYAVVKGQLYCSNINKAEISVTSNRIVFMAMQVKQEDSGTPEYSSVKRKVKSKKIPTPKHTNIDENPTSCSLRNFRYFQCSYLK